MCLRFLFVPLFMLCHVPKRAWLPTIFWQDAYFITFMLLFAISNGYLVSLTMCLAPRSGEQRVGCWWQGDRVLQRETITPRLLSSDLWCHPIGQAFTVALAPGYDLGLLPV